MLDFELSHKVDIKKLQIFTVGDSNNAELLNKLISNLNRLTSKNENLTYKEVFSHFCPKLNFSNIDNLCNEFLNKIKSELVVMQILNSDKEEDYFQNVINGIFLKYIFMKTLKINDKIRMRIDSMLENLNTLTESKKYTNLMKKQLGFLLKDCKKSPKTKKLDTASTDQEIISPFGQNQNKIYSDYTDSNRTQNNSSPFFQEKYQQPSNDFSIPNFYGSIGKTKYESASVSNRKNYENFSFYNPNLNSVQVGNLTSSYKRDNSQLNSKNNRNAYSATIPSSNQVNNNLTNEVWPKTRTLLSIGSKMYRENLITSEQRGILKELILDQNPNLNMFLSIYEMNNNYQILYDNIIKLISQFSE